MIIIEPIGGLANRMRVIASGIWLKGILNTDLTIIWNENYELNCPFDLLFENSDAFKIISKPISYRYLKPSNEVGLIKRTLFSLRNKLIGIDYCIIEGNFPSNTWIGINILSILSAQKDKNIYIQTCQEFGDNIPSFKYLIPIKKIKDKINLITKNFNQLVVGVHIRRTDNVISIEKSPIELFIKAIEKKLITEEKTTFFLCSDDHEVEKKIISTFGNSKIIINRKENSRITIHGMQDAVTDLYCLSYTSEIFGSYWSSFTEVAAKFNNTQLTIIKID
ncbi:hypothetical protein [Mucilaginibacter pocheonensis]|uniref:Glycosyl transferase family 11 n=1 Tax=Mucilaginibacter pocheonensis TaxID=398050 RepID=A0ABU1TH00_9SPHI|nr:hypothetical protein [Mucilaginibacter pocheonensis]MDR6944695.1 hypothetical protein [Mucilaginibacter pocheonensis]